MLLRAWLCLVLAVLLLAPAAFAGVVAPVPSGTTPAGPDAKFSPPASGKGATSALVTYTNLLKEMEQQTKFPFQNSDWRNQRLDWLEKLNDASDVPGHAAQLAAYEASLLDNAVTATWRARRDDWRGEVAAVTTVSRLAALTDELANNLQPAAMDGSWRARRELWHDHLRELINPGDAIDTNELPATGDEPPTVGSPAGAYQLNSLLAELETATRRDALTKRWRDRRAAWLAAVQAQDTVGLRGPLQQLGEAYLGQHFIGDWRPGAGWSARVRAATDLPALAALLLELEDNIEWTATDTTWPARSNDWRRFVNSAGNPPAATAVTPPVSDPVRSFAAALREVEKNTSYSAQTESWRDDRAEWLERVNAAATATALRALLQEYARSLLPGQLLSGWSARSSAWHSDVGRATSCSKLAGLLLEFESQLRVAATEDDWRTARTAWRDRLTALGGSAPAATSTTTTAPANTGTIATLAAQCASMMGELENSLPYATQLDTWRSNRPAWCAANGSARTVEAAGRQLLALAAAMRESAMRAEWSGRHDAWRSAVSAAATLPAVIQLLREFEQGLAPATFDRSWQAKRAEWLARLDELAAGRAVTLPPAST